MTLCEHMIALRPVTAYSRACDECADRGLGWAALRLCLNCGWVACSDESPGQHAKAHYEETDHAVTAAIGPGPRHWCYVHGRIV